MRLVSFICTIASTLTLNACSLIRDGSQIAREATPTINALLEAGQKNNLGRISKWLTAFSSTIFEETEWK